jgi:CSLREA domain-containing protein
MEGAKMKKPSIIASIFILIVVWFAFPVSDAQAETITVNTIIDEEDGSCTDGDCSLRDAINIANGNGESDTINFSIVGCMPCTITLNHMLPILTDDGTTIDGYSQFGAFEATDSSAAIIRVAIDGSALLGASYGLVITSTNNTVRGLAVYHFNVNGISIVGEAASGNVISGNYLGVDADGVTDKGNGANGVFIGLGAHHNTIGGDIPADRNLISGNAWEGVGIHGGETNNNVVSGNYIGTNAAGNGDLGNSMQGVRIYGGAHDNTIGGDTEGDRNLISGNDKDGVAIIGDGTNDNTVSGNYIGITISGELALPNNENGIEISGGAQNNTVGGIHANPGGTCAGECNAISGNIGSGVYISDEGTTGNTVSGNYIGTDPKGIGDLGNNYAGVVIFGNAADNLIGGDSSGERNVISGNDTIGVYVLEITLNSAQLTQYSKSGLLAANTSGNVISGNYIGTNATGTAEVGNSWSGVWLGAGAENTTVGGDSPGEGNLISGNLRDGVLISASSGNTIIGNYIGTDAAGTSAVQNWEDGIHLAHGAENNQIGGNTLMERNLISGNHERGIFIEGITASGNVVKGNYIGTDLSGTLDLGNGQDGIILENGTHDNTIGGTAQGEGNLIGFNGYGISLLDINVTNNVIAGNFIGTDSEGDLDLGNNWSGVHCMGTDNTIGPDNIIANNFAWGVYIPGGVGTVVTQNSIFSNGTAGIHLEPGANNDLAAPVILSVSGWPVRVTGSACDGCTVEIFANREDEQEGKVYLWSGVATEDEVFDIPLNWVPYAYLTATATDDTDGTSEFSTTFTTSVVRAVYLPLVVR